MTNQITTGIEDNMTVVCYTYHEAVTYARIMLGVDRASIYKRMQGHSIGFSPLVGDVRFYREDKGTWSVRLKTAVIETAPVVMVEPVIAEDVPVIEDAVIEDAPVMKAYRGGLSYDTDENGEQYLYHHCLTRAEDGSVIYVRFGKAHRVLAVFASGGGDYLTYESSPFEGAWDIYGEWLSDSEADPEGYDRWEAASEARAAAGLEALQDLQIEWEKEENSGYQRGSRLAKMRDVKIEGIDE